VPQGVMRTARWQRPPMRLIARYPSKARL